MANPLTTDFNGQEGTLAFWVQCLSSDANSGPSDWSLFHVRSVTTDGTFSLDVRVPDAGEAKPDALTIDYTEVGTDTDTITDSDFISSNWQMVAVTWSYADTDHEMRYYKNGALVTTATDIAEWTAGAPTTFEASIGPAYHDMSHMAIWDVALAASDIANIYAVGTAANAVTMDIDRGAYGASLRFYNPTVAKCYVTSLQIKGKRIKRYRESFTEVVDNTSRSRYGQSNMDWDMPYESDPAFAALFANWLLTKVSDPLSKIESLQFTANASSAIFKQALVLEPGDRVSVQEDQTGLNAAFHIAGIEYQLADADNMQVTLYLVAADQSAAWNIGSAGFSEIGTTTFLAL